MILAICIFLLPLKVLTVNDHHPTERILPQSDPTNVESHLRKLDFTTSYNTIYDWKSDKNILDHQKLNPLSHHDAQLDDQMALKFWFGLESPKKSFYLEKLMQNPTVDFSIQKSRVLVQVAQSGNYQLLQRLIKEKDLTLDSSVLINALGKDKFNAFKYLTRDLGISPDKFIFSQAISAQNDQLLRYMITELGFKVYKVDLDQCIEWADWDFLKFLLENCQEKPDQMTLFRAVEAQNLNAVKYLIGLKIKPDFWSFRAAMNSGNSDLSSLFKKLTQ